MWRVGTKVPINVYDGDRPVCQCHSREDAELICTAVNLGFVWRDIQPLAQDLNHKLAAALNMELHK